MIGVIDIGSNSVRLMLIDLGFKQKFVNTTGLARGSMGGILQKEAMEKTSRAVKEYCDLAKSYNAKKIYAFATEAVRSAQNKAEFIDAVKRTADLDIVVVPSDKEAEMGFKGAYLSDRCLVFDIGGASTEIIVGDENNIYYEKSVPVGVVRILDSVNGGADETQFIKSKLREYGDIPTADNYLAIGGTAGSIVSLEEELEPYDPSVTHLYRLEKSIVCKWMNILHAMPVCKIKDLKGLDDKRAEIIAGGAALLYYIMDKLGIDYVTVSENDNLEGFLSCYDIDVI